jgi:curved DNA-binding protein CbpA
MQREDLFAVLECAPTLDRDAIKQAYFRALALHPPHADPEAFRQIRAAYERLMAPGALETAYLTRPPDLDGELARYRQRFDRALAEAAAELHERVAPLAALEAFADRASRCKYPWRVFGAGPAQAREIDPH